MSKKNTNLHLPKSKGTDMATYYAPKECKKK